METFTIASGLTILVGIILFLMLLNVFVPVGLWITAFFSGVKVSLGTMILFKYVERTPIWQRIGLPTRATKEAGFAASEVRSDRVGKVGVAVTDLRPSGTGMFDGERLDVVTEGGYIDSQGRIEIVRDEGYRLIVRRISQPN